MDDDDVGAELLGQAGGVIHVRAGLLALGRIGVAGEREERGMHRQQDVLRRPPPRASSAEGLLLRVAVRERHLAGIEAERPHRGDRLVRRSRRKARGPEAHEPGSRQHELDVPLAHRGAVAVAAGAAARAAWWAARPRRSQNGPAAMTVAGPKPSSTFKAPPSPVSAEATQRMPPAPRLATTPSKRMAAASASPGPATSSTWERMAWTTRRPASPRPSPSPLASRAYAVAMAVSGSAYEPMPQRSTPWTTSSPATWVMSAAASSWSGPSGSRYRAGSRPSAWAWASISAWFPEQLCSSDRRHLSRTRKRARSGVTERLVHAPRTQLGQRDARPAAAGRPRPPRAPARRRASRRPRPGVGRRGRSARAPPRARWAAPEKAWPPSACRTSDGSPAEATRVPSARQISRVQTVARLAHRPRNACTTPGSAHGRRTIARAMPELPELEALARRSTRSCGRAPIASPPWSTSLWAEDLRPALRRHGRAPLHRRPPPGQAPALPARRRHRR